MANSRTKGLRARVSGGRLGGTATPFRRRRDQEAGAREGSIRAARAAAEMADGMLLAAGAETAWHSREVERIALRLADRLGLNGEQRQSVGITARLHDIGKVALPPALLQKPTRPTAKEWKLIHGHTVIGERILRSVEELREIAPFVRHSHERWDGGGYPDGLTGFEIPQVSRIVFCADAFHAICTDRPYSSGRSMAEALAEIRRCAGTQFEPRVVTALAGVVRDEMYGPLRLRRRSHARLSMLLVIALTLGGSIAGGIAAGRDASSLDPIQDYPPLAAPVAPRLEAGAAQMAPALAPRGGVAGAVESSQGTPPADSPARSRTEPGPEVEAQLPAVPVRPPSGISVIGETTSGLESKLQPPSDPTKDARSPATGDGSQAPAEVTPPPPEQQLPALGATQQIASSVSSVSTSVTAPPPRPRRPASKKRR